MPWQQVSETIDQVVLQLKKFSKEYDCKNVPGEPYRLEFMRDAFIAGMLSAPIRQRLLENMGLTFGQAYEQARAQEMDLKNAETFKKTITAGSSTSLKDFSSADSDEANFLQAASRSKKTCYFCVLQNHPRNTCPAKAAACYYCNKLGHFSRACQKRLQIGEHRKLILIQLQLQSLNQTQQQFLLRPLTIQRKYCVM